MSNTFTAQELADFYQKVADGGEAQLKIDGEWSNLFVGGPSLGSSNAKWRIKPTQKVIDLSVLIDSQIDCEFKDRNRSGVFINKLSRQGDPSMNYRYYDGDGDTWESCQPRMNHKHAWLGGECPLPEGFRVKVWWRDDDYDEKSRRLVSELIWSHDNTSSDIIAFEVLGVADGYVMPWEVSDDF